MPMLSRSPHPSPIRTIPVGLAFLGLLAVAYPLAAETTAIPLAAFALPPLLVAISAGTRVTAQIGALALAIAVVEGSLDDGLSGAALVARCSIVAAAGVLAAFSAHARQQRENDLGRAVSDAEVLGSRLSAISRSLHAGRLGTWQWDLRTGAVIWDNDLERLFGLVPETFGGTIDAWIALLHPDDREQALCAIDDAVRTTQPFAFEHRCVWPDGTQHWLEGIGEPLLDADGTVVGAVGVAADIDERHAAGEALNRLMEFERRTRSRSEYLAQATRSVGSSLDIDELVANITAAAVPGLGDWCQITLLLEDSKAPLVRTAVADRRPEIVALTRRLEHEYPFRHDEPTGAARAIRTGETVHQAVIDDHMLDAAFPDSNRRSILKALDLRSVILVPIRTPLGVLGSLQLVRTSQSPPYDLDDVALAEDLATTIGIAVHNAQSYRRQRSARSALEVLQSLTGRLAVAVTVDDVVQEVITHATRGLQADGGLLYRVQDDASLSLAGQSGYDPLPLQDWHTIPMRVRAPVADAVRSGKPIILRNRDEIARQYPYYAEAAPLEAAVIALPLQIRRVMTGGLLFSFKTAHDFSDDELTMLETLAGRCAGAIERATLYEQQRAASLTLQRRLLPELPPLPVWLEAAGHYQPATGGEVGGDWFQLIPVSYNRFAAVLGDAVGRGVPAAAAMGQLRGVVTGAASVDPDPAAVLRATDSFAQTAADTFGATLAYALIDKRLRTIRHASAGHVPGIILRQDRTTEILMAGRSPLLGVRSTSKRFEVASTSFTEGDTLILYSDGLIERREEAIDAGIDRLCHTLTSLADHSPDVLSKLLVREMLADRSVDDDVAVLVVRRPMAATEPP